VFKTSIFSVISYFNAINCLSKETKTTRKISHLKRQKRIAQSPQFYQGRVYNKMPRVPYQGSKVLYNLKSFFNRSQAKRLSPLPHATPDISLLKKRSKALRVTWLGHSTLFLEVNKTRILIDPVFEFASPLMAKYWFNRNVSTAINKKDLPLPDMIVISHDHYDHLEKSTMKYFADKPIKFFVPLGVGKHLEKWGIQPEKIHEFDWWESTNINGIEITSAPANHNSGRTGFDNNKTLWCSWAFQTEYDSVFFSGDSAYDTHFKAINKRLGRFDIVFMEVAANIKKAGDYPVENCGHMQASHTIKAFQDLNAEKLFPVHWSTFELFIHQWDEPMNDLIQEADKIGANLITPMVGEIINPKETNSTYYWWMDLPNYSPSPTKLTKPTLRNKLIS
jgi:L-ascorbate metabolism protein UlaG (beta-lactamase superfamily)